MSSVVGINVRHIGTVNQIGSTIHGLMGARKLTYKEFVSRAVGLSYFYRQIQ